MSARILLAALVAATAAACWVGPGDGATSSGGPTPSGSGNPPTGGGTTTPTDLPCDVSALLQAKCTSCHSSPPSGGAPMPLVSYADLTAKSLSDPSKTFAEQSVVRMQNTASPMPPGGGATSSDVQVLQSWITAGYPNGACDAGTTTTNDYNTPVVCTSGATNTASEGSQMRPGRACNACHAQSGGEAPQFSIAGTVYPTAHEPDNCVGVGSGAVQVVIMDTNGNTQLTLSTNSSGNFDSRTAISTPYRAKVVANGKERVMSATQTDGDCNSCHTETGANGAPGRIMAPN